MSLALDLGLFLRNSKTKLNLTHSQRSILFALAIRIGSNGSAWISQEVLSQEIGMPERTLRHCLSSIKKLKSSTKTEISKLVIIEKLKSDKRRNVYRFDDLLTNYHQKTDSEKKKIHINFGDEYAPPSPLKLSTGKKSIKKYRQPIAGNYEDIGNTLPLNTGNPLQVSQDSKSLETRVPSTFQEIENSPKATDKSNRYNQSNRARGSVKLTSYQEDFEPDQIRTELLYKHAERCNMPVHELFDKFKNVSIKYKTKSKDWQQSLQKFLEDERPRKVYEDKAGQRKRYDGNPINY